MIPRPYNAWMSKAAPGTWVIACRSRELRHRPLRAIVDGAPVVLFRDERAHACALEDRCAHRNAPLSAGRVCAGRLQCRYHGWAYDGSGSVAEVPALEPAALGRLRLSVRSFPVREQQGFVWLATAPEPFPAEPHVFAGLDDPQVTSFVMRTRFRGTVEACLENFLDCPHATFVHRGWFRSPTARKVRAVVRTRADGAQAEFFEEPREGSVVWTLLAPRRGAMRHIDRYVAPATSEVRYEFPDGRHYTITSCCNAVSATETLVHTVVSFRYGRIGPLVRLVFEPLSRLIIAQDVRMLAEQQANVERYGGERFANTPADLLRPHIAGWRRALAEGTTTPCPGEERTVEIRL
jgi:phenylpropionate dioxygenase-like ring-hydroxylating dioxygenase large terminal subunit